MVTDGITAKVFLAKLEELVIDRQGASATTFDVEVCWRDGFLYKCDGFDVTRETAMATIDKRLCAYRSRQSPTVDG